MSIKTKARLAQSISEPKEESNIMIEHSIPVPAYRSRTKYPFQLLQPGDSFVIPKIAQRASVTVNYWKEKMKKAGAPAEFTVRELEKDEIQDLKAKGRLDQSAIEACRVWRVDGVKREEV